MAGAKPKRGSAVELRILPIAHDLDGPLGSIEVRPHVGAALAAVEDDKRYL